MQKIQDAENLFQRIQNTETLLQESSIRTIALGVLSSHLHGHREFLSKFKKPLSDRTELLKNSKIKNDISLAIKNYSEVIDRLADQERQLQSFEHNLSAHLRNHSKRSAAKTRRSSNLYEAPERNDSDDVTDQSNKYQLCLNPSDCKEPVVPTFLELPKKRKDSLSRSMPSFDRPPKRKPCKKNLSSPDLKNYPKQRESQSKEEKKEYESDDEKEWVMPSPSHVVEKKPDPKRNWGIFDIFR